MYTGYLYYNSTEIGNNERVVAYLKGNPAEGIPALANPNMSVAASCGCTSARCLYCDPGSGVDGAYQSPRLDDAPWFDPDVPDSEEFAGFFIEEITGFDSTVRRDFSDGAISGGSLGPLRLAGRCMTVTGWLLSRSCCGAEYGLRWLQEALMGNNFCEDCAYGDLYTIKCCPPPEDNCYTSEVGVTDTIPSVVVDLTVTDDGSGVYTFIIDDAVPANLISDPDGPANNTDGPIPSCYAAGNSFRFVLADDAGSISTFFVPFEAITSFATDPSGAGASATFTVDTAIVGSCDDVARDILRLVDQVAGYFDFHASGVTVPTNSPTQVRCFETREGYDPQDYVRLQHRVGLTEGPTVLERMGSCCTNDCGCTSLRVEFTLCAENPHIFSDVKWCIEDQNFDFDDCYCYDTRRLCNTCDTTRDNKIVQREVRRPECNITLRHDQTWCPEGWGKTQEGCPPNDCELVVGSLEEFVPEDNSEVTAGTANLTRRLLVNINDDFTWSPLNWNPSEGVPPTGAEIFPFNGGNCSTPYENQYVAEQGGVECNFFASIDPFPSYTWKPFLWDPVTAGWPPSPCSVTVVPGVCECPTTAERPKPPDTDPPTPDPVIDCGGGIWYNPETCTRGCDPCGACNTCRPDCNDDGELKKCPIRLIWNKANNTYRFEPLTFIGGTGGLTGYGNCDCFEVSEYVIEGVEPCLIRVYYDEITGSQTWEPIGWSGNIPAPSSCDCIQIAEIVVTRNEASGCVDDVQCPINVICDVEYRPGQCTTRQAMSAFFYRYNGSPAYNPPTTPTFSDVGLYSDFYTEVEWANSVGILTGFPNGTFRPGDSISRQAAAAAFYRDAGSPAFVPPAVPTFNDVGPSNPFYTEIEWCASELLFFGFSDGSFRPGDCLSRRAAAIVFYRYANVQPTFSDVPCVFPLYTEIEWAYSEGIFTGFADSTFRPTNSLSRQVAAANFYRAAGSPAFVPPGVPTFIDVPLTHPFFLEIEWVNSMGILTGVGPNFFPSNVLTRQAAAVAFYRFNGSPPYTPPAIQTFTDVAPAHPFYTEIEWVADQGIATGFPDGTFRPADPTSRQAMAAFFYRNAGSPAYTPACYEPTLPPYFGDVPASDPQFRQIEWMRDAGVTLGFVNAKSWEPLGWDFDPGNEFPPLGCNFVIATVNGAVQDTSPIIEEIEVPYDEFVPDCGPFPSPPPPPTIFTTDCFCEPWEQARKCCTFTNPADWNEATTLVKINTGSEEMRNLKIEAYRNPFGEKVPCPCDPEDDFWECRDPCATILVPQLPPRSKLTIDSRQRIAQLELESGRVINALRFIFSGDGKPFGWFDIGQCSTFCIVVQADCRQTAVDATVSVGAVGRYVASGG